MLKNSNFFFPRSTQDHLEYRLNSRCTEIVYVDKVQKCDVLVSEWKFSGKNSEKLQDFLQNLKKCEKEAKENFLGQSDSFLHSYHSFELVEIIQDETFSWSFTIGQKIFDNSVCLYNNNVKINLPIFVSHMIAGMRWLHDNGMYHGNIKRASVWAVLENKNAIKYVLSDHIFARKMLNFCEKFTNITDEDETEAAQKEECEQSLIVLQQKDMRDLAKLLEYEKPKTHESWDSDLDDTGVSLNKPNSDTLLNNFIQACKDAESVEELLKHPFLYSDIDKYFSANSENHVFPKCELETLTKNFYALRFLGEGGFGIVTAARHKIDKRDYAVKMIFLEDFLPEQESNENHSKSEIEKAIREVNALSSFDHSNIVKYYNTWTEEVENEDDDDDSIKSASGSQSEESDINITQILHIQMEYCENDLKKLIDSSALQFETRLKWNIFRQVLNGLFYIHSKGYAHRDLKPGNILLTKNNVVKLGDFGLAKLFEINETNQRTYKNNLNENTELDVGTNIYIAPELKSNKKVKNYLISDIYSLGIVLFEIFYRPFNTQTEKYIVISKFAPKMDYNFEKKLPSDFGEYLSDEDKRDVRMLLDDMLDVTPQNRPTAKALREDKNVPFDEIDVSENMKKYHEMLKNRYSPYFRFIVSELFSAEIVSKNKAKQIKPEIQKISTTKCTLEIHIILKKVFELHGIRELKRNFILPYREKDMSLPAYPIIDRYGRHMTLSTDLHQNFAPLFCKALNVRCFTCGKAITSNTDGAMLIEYDSCAAAFFAPKKFSSNVAAEVIYFIADLRNHFTKFSKQKLQIFVGHVCITKAVTSLESPLELMMIGRTYELKIDGKIISTKPYIDFNSFQQNLSLLDNTAEALEDIAKMISYLDLITQRDKISLVFDPYLSNNKSKFTDGICYELRMELPHSTYNRSFTILEGGQYESFFVEAYMNTQKSSMCAYGINILLHNFLSAYDYLKKYETNRSVLIYTKSYENIAIKVWKQLKAANHSSSIYHAEDASEESLLAHCRLLNYGFLFIITDEDAITVHENTKLTQNADNEEDESDSDSDSTSSAFSKTYKMCVEKAVSFVLNNSLP